MQESNKWLATAYIELDNYDKYVASLEKQVKTSYIVGTISTNLAGVAPIVIGLVEVKSGNKDKGFTYIKTGACILGGINLVYQSGHWLFKFW